MLVKTPVKIVAPRMGAWIETGYPLAFEFPVRSRAPHGRVD